MVAISTNFTTSNESNTLLTKSCIPLFIRRRINRCDILLECNFVKVISDTLSIKSNIQNIVRESLLSCRINDEANLIPVGSEFSCRSGCICVTATIVRLMKLSISLHCLRSLNRHYEFYLTISESGRNFEEDLACPFISRISLRFHFDVTTFFACSKHVWGSGEVIFFSILIVYSRILSNNHILFVPVFSSLFKLHVSELVSDSLTCITIKLFGKIQAILVCLQVFPSTSRFNTFGLEDASDCRPLTHRELKTSAWSRVTTPTITSSSCLEAFRSLDSLRSLNFHGHLSALTNIFCWDSNPKLAVISLVTTSVRDNLYITTLCIRNEASSWMWILAIRIFSSWILIVLSVELIVEIPLRTTSTFNLNVVEVECSISI